LDQSGLSGAEAGVRIRDCHAATTAAGGALPAMGEYGSGDNGGARVIGSHESSFAG
jgi:hypothetical protein